MPPRLEIVMPPPLMSSSVSFRSRAFCAPVRVPHEVYLVLRPHGGQTDWTTFLHELGHALGLIHEHKRPDRDQYVTVRTPWWWLWWLSFGQCRPRLR